MTLPASQLAIQGGLARIVDGAFSSGQGAGINTFGQVSSNNEGRKPTYRAGIVGYTPQATAQDFITLTGNPLVVARLLYVEVWIAATAACSMELQLVYNSAPDTGGTSAVCVNAPADPLDAAGQCVMAAYSVAPTAGTTVNLLAAGRCCGPIIGGAGGANPLQWAFGWNNDKCPVLRTASQQFALNNIGAALPAGLKMSVRFQWSEEPLTGN